mmetsp:Transcript_25516/g.76908  ORF Transcript_25516/g.76908 Transcript_25516/m.76908 type:complete len:123 (+) Transcript_25516:1393-1761(+)
MDAMFAKASKFNQDLGWCLDKPEDAGFDTAFEGTACEGMEKAYATWGCGVYKDPCSETMLAARDADAIVTVRDADAVTVTVTALVAVCVLAGVALGGLATLLAPKAKEPIEQEPLLAAAAKI